MTTANLVHWGDVRIWRCDHIRRTREEMLGEFRSEGTMAGGYPLHPDDARDDSDLTALLQEDAVDGLSRAQIDWSGFPRP